MHSGMTLEERKKYFDDFDIILNLREEIKKKDLSAFPRERKTSLSSYF